MPRNVDSRKNAVNASSASGAPKMSPMKRAYSDQFMPKWNSCTMPVTTPMPKLMRKIVPKNFASLRDCSFQAGRFVMTEHVSSSARKMDRPSVSGTNKKW